MYVDHEARLRARYEQESEETVEELQACIAHLLSIPNEENNQARTDYLARLKRELSPVGHILLVHLMINSNRQESESSQVAA